MKEMRYPFGLVVKARFNGILTPPKLKLFPAAIINAEVTLFDVAITFGPIPNSTPFGNRMPKARVELGINYPYSTPATSGTNSIMKQGPSILGTI